MGWVVSRYKTRLAATRRGTKGEWGTVGRILFGGGKKGGRQFTVNIYFEAHALYVCIKGNELLFSRESFIFFKLPSTVLYRALYFQFLSIFFLSVSMVGDLFLKPTTTPSSQHPPEGVRRSAPETI